MSDVPPSAAPAAASRLGRSLAPGAVFLASGAGLVVHVLTGAALPAAVLTLGGVGGVVAARSLAADPAARSVWARRVGVGVVAGLVGTAGYDASRWALVQVGGFSVSPFGAFPLFGEALLAGRGGPAAQHAAGVAFHLLNGVCFGIAYTVWFGTRGWRAGVAFALGLEALMLAVYPGWLDLRSLREFTQMSVLGHVGYGVVLGVTAKALLARSSP